MFNFNLGPTISPVKHFFEHVQEWWMADVRPFSWGVWIGGLFLAIIIGAVGNVLAGLMAIGMHQRTAGFAIGAAPGAILLALSAAIYGRVRSLALGMMCGATLILLIGGACGASMIGTSFH
jgi:hypothetical protein